MTHPYERVQIKLLFGLVRVEIWREDRMDPPIIEGSEDNEWLEAHRYKYEFSVSSIFGEKVYMVFRTATPYEIPSGSRRVSVDVIDG